MKNRITLLFVFLIFVSANYAQQERSTKLIRLDETSKHQLSEAEFLIKESLKLSSDDDLVLVKSEADQLGFTHNVYQQYFNGIKVEFGKYIAHAKNGNIQSMNGNIFEVGKVKVSSNITNEIALQRAISYVGAEKYLWESPEQARIMDDYQRPAGELMILPAEVFKGNKARLVYKFDVYAIQPVSRAYIYVDAHSGEVVFKNNIIKHADGDHFEKYSRTTKKSNENAPFIAGNAQTKYSGTRTIETSLSGGSYRLRETSRGNGIETYDMNMGINYNSAVDFTDNDNSWTTAEHSANDDDAALDAHWGAEMTYDYFDQTFNRNSYDNNGATIKSYVHFDLVEYGYSNQDNAFWNGSVMTYGDGTSFDPLTSLDIAAHEIGHALCENTADLVYS